MINLWVLLATHLRHVRNARRSREGIRAQQLRQFRRLVAHAQRKSPYYRELISARGIDIDTCVPGDFPLLTKSVLMERFDDIVTDRRIRRDAIAGFLASSHDPSDIFLGRYTVIHTSGTSGEPGYFVYSPADWARGLSHSLRINPFRPGRRKMAFYGAIGGHFTGASFAASTQYSVLKLKYKTACFDINRPVAEVIDGLNAFQPDILMGYASGLALLAQRQADGELNISPRWVQSSGEVMTAADWEFIESVFGVPLLNVYSCTEHLLMGLGTREFGGTYLFEDELIFEPAPDHTLVTNLFNYTLPLIRYRMDDIMEPIPDTVKAFPYPKVREVAGRSECIPYFTNSRGQEDFISPHVINEFLVKYVRRFQLQVVDKTSCVFRVCLEPGLTEKQRAVTLAEVEVALRDIFAQKDMANVSCRVEVVDALLPDPRTGKFRLIIV